MGYGKGGSARSCRRGPLAIGRYGFLVTDVTKGGRKDVKLGLYYDRVPSLLALKNVLPDAFQRVFRLRRSSQRIVTYREAEAPSPRRRNSIEPEPSARGSTRSPWRSRRGGPGPEIRGAPRSSGKT